ncbi:MAG TPA: bifunctional diguanylate cyclase/phosphodiesterase [Noviherbaspirillum sp.]
MIGSINDEQALAILYDLALTIGGEVNVEPLMVRTLQRLMYHTGLPVGLWLEHADTGADGLARACLQLAIGDYRLVRRRGETLAVAPVLVQGPPALLEVPAELAALNPRKPQRVALRLPVPGDGVLLLLGAAAPASRVALPELFAPILAGLGRALTLCRSYEQEVRHRVERTAYYDPLTGLPNAILFGNTLQQAVVKARATGRWLAQVQIDVDDFRRFNEVHGREDGDRLLVALAARLGAQLRPGDLLARAGGDEFCLLLPNLSGWDEIDERIVHLLQLNRMPLQVGDTSLDVSFSAGVAVMPADAEDGDTLARHAQMALHQAKQEARGYFRLFDADQDKRTHERRELLHRLKTAMENRELQLYYQPKADMPSGRIIGFEALLRWQHPERGMMPPQEFLPIVENSDFMIQLGEWGMREALRQAVAWRNAGMETCISVNIAGRHLLQPDFSERVRRALADVAGARASNLEIEILESSFLGDLNHVREVMRACSALGVRFALDDFGTGYSSLAYLHQLPASTIKIDQLFIRNMFLQREEPAIIRAIVEIADVFGRHLVAEGVEDAEHGMLLVCMGCQGGQGYGISRPMRCCHGWKPTARTGNGPA